MTEGAGVPYSWAEGYAKMLDMNPPQGFTARQWQAAIDSAGRFIDEWAGKVAALGWTVEETAYFPEFGREQRRSCLIGVSHSFEQARLRIVLED